MFSFSNYLCYSFLKQFLIANWSLFKIHKSGFGRLVDVV